MRSRPRRPPAPLFAALPFLLLGVPLLGSGCGDGGAAPPGAPRIAFITNGTADFWTIAEAGARAGAEEFGASVDVLMPADLSHQKNMIEDCLTKRVDGIAISPIDPVNQADQIDAAAARTRVVTHDSDAPGTDRLAYVGMDNYSAGWMCGELVREALPDGGKIAIFVGRLEQDNARRRRQGVIDSILGRSRDPGRFDPPNATPATEDGRYRIVGTFTDQFDRARGKANVEDALSRHPDLAAAVGLFGYNPPLILEALKGADALGEVRVVAFDEDLSTLQGIAEGHVVGTVVQDPFAYGRESVRILAGLARGKSLAELGVSEGGLVDIPARAIGPAEVEAFRAELARNLGREQGR